MISPYFLLIPILLPIVGGFSLLFLRLPGDADKKRNLYLETIVVITSILVWTAVLFVRREAVQIISLSGK